jgi:hypothetical protein
MSERRGSDTWFALLCLAVVLLPCLAYSAGYAWMRASHRLVHYASSISPASSPMTTPSTDELVYLPAAWMEETVRGAVDPTW